MEIVLRKIDELTAYDGNARTHNEQQLDDLRNSITSFGFNDPIEIGTDFVVISGHARLTAAIQLGMTEVPTIMHKHLYGTKTQAYVLAANRIAQSAGWDAGILKDEFQTLTDEDSELLLLTGFSESEIDAYLNPEVLNLGLGDEDETQTANDSQIVTTRGDLWIMGEHRLKCGDATFVDDVTHLLIYPPHLMVTDPPYGVEYDPAWRKRVGKSRSENMMGTVLNDDKANWLDAYALFPGDVAYIWHAGLFTHVVAENLEQCGFKLISQLIWSKENFALSRGDYHWKHEPCWYAVKTGANHHWNGARDQSTIWEIKMNKKEEEREGHGTQKPVECMARPITTNSKPNDWVYDPFGGSGTTLIACEKLGRKCAMLELSEKYCDVIVRRWMKFTGKQAYLESTGESFDAAARKTDSLT